MTSETIQALRNQLIDDPRIDTNVAQAAALYEIAYQLAVANENRDDLTVCICGHPFAHHEEIPKNVGRAQSCCKSHPCGCDSFRPIHPAAAVPA